MTSLKLRNGLSYGVKPNRVDFYSAASQAMVVVDVIGDPAEVTSQVVPALYAMAYAVRKLYKDKGHPFTVDKLRGRWPDDVRATPRAQWQGLYGLPVPNDLQALPPPPVKTQAQAISPRLEVWHYGHVAATLHEGDFRQEADTLDALFRQISERNLQVIPDSHEEVYLTDPRTSTPEQYKTIILRRVQSP